MPRYDTSVVATKLAIDVSVEADAAALKMEGNEHQGVRASCGPWQIIAAICVRSLTGLSCH